MTDNTMALEMLATTGAYEAWATEAGTRAEVRRGDLKVKFFNGETAWSEAVRYAEGLNSKASALV